MLRELELFTIATEQPLGSAEISATLVLQSTVSKELIGRQIILASRDRLAQQLADQNANWHWQVEFATLHREAIALIGEIDRHD
jgi:hypothetical protein